MQENRVSVGENESEIEEEFPDPKIKEIVPKKVQIYNTGPVPCFARVKILWSDARMREKAEIDIDEGVWEYQAEDDYYYYKKVLEPYGGMASFFTTVRIKDPEQEENFDLMIYEETYQQGKFLDSQYKEAFREYQKNKGQENGDKKET